MNNLETLTALLDMTIEAGELASEVEKPVRLRDLVVELRSKAKDERTQARRNHRIETSYDLCMVGILQELNFGRISWDNVQGLDSRLARMREEIERTMEEIRTNRRIM
jgi:hypothetical protein